MAGKKDVQYLSDWELLNELKSLGMKVGPISPTTRRIYEKQLSKVRGYDVVDNTREDLNTRADVLVPWVPEDIFFLWTLMVRGEAALTRRKAPRRKK